MLGSNFGAGPPTNLAVVVLDYNAVSLSWVAPTTAPDWYEVEVRPSGGTWYHIISIYGTSYDLAGLNAATSYDFRVRGVKATWPLEKYGPWSTVATDTTDAYRAADYTVTNDATWTTAAAAAIKGEIIEITAGVSLEEKTCPNPATGTGFLTIRSSAMASLPGWDKRVGVGDLANMPTFFTDQSVTAAMRVNSNTDHVTFEGIAFRSQQSSGRTNYIVYIDGTADTITDIQIHRCYLDAPVPTGGITQTDVGLQLDRCSRVLCKDTSIIEITGNINDTQAILFIRANEIGINNCRLEGGGENVMCGGVPHGSTNIIPDLLCFGRNHFVKPLNWNPSEGSYDGVTRVVKNLFELKYASHVNVFDNKFEHHWVGGQTHAITITPRAEAGAMPWISDDHLQFCYNWVHNIDGGMSLLWTDYNSPAGSDGNGIRWASFYHNLWTGTTVAGTERWVSISATASQFRTRARDIAIFKNTVIPTGTVKQFWLNGTPDLAAAYPDNRGLDGDLIFRDNIVPFGTGNPSGVITSGDGYGKDAMINTFGSLTNVIWEKNVQYGQRLSENGEALYPGQYHAVNGQSDVGFTNYAGGDYTLTPESAYIAAASDGGACGADVAAVVARTLHCEDGDWT